VPVEKVCDKIKRANPEVCEVNYPDIVAYETVTTTSAGDGRTGSSSAAEDEVADTFDKLLDGVSVAPNANDDDYEF
jgi:hypothetical protein